MDWSESLSIDDGYVLFKQEDLFAENLPHMREIRRQGKLCDVKISVENQSFSAHRVVLAATIPYFYAMFINDMMEQSQKEIKMKGEIEAQALESLINFAYSGVVKIDNQNVQSLMVGASYLQLSKVRDACAEFIISKFHPQNVLGIRRFADSMSCTNLVTAADNYINNYFLKVIHSEEFLALTFEELLDLIKRDELNTPSEEQIFECCMRWVKADQENRVNLLPQVLSRVRLPLLTPQYLADHVATEELIKTSHQCRDLVDEAKDCHLMPERRALVQSYRTRQRYRNVGGCIYAVGGLTKVGEPVSTVEIYDPAKKEWRMGEPMSSLRSRVGVAVTGGKLYAFGGFNGSERLSTVEIYDPKLKKWSQGKQMVCKRSAVGVAALNNFIYVCGGYDGITSLSTVESYCPNTDTWLTVAPMMKYRSAGGAATLGRYIYALGGHDGLSIFDSVERYDPATNTWTKVKPMLNRRCRLGVAALNDKLYACGGYDGNTFLRSVEMYDPVKDKWEHVAPMNVKRSRVALTANMGKLYACGGYDGESNLSTVEVYDPETNTWTFDTPMVAHGGGVGAAVIPNV